MTRLTGDVLDAAKVEAGRLRLELAGCDLRQLTRELVATHEARAALRGIRLVAVLPTEPTMVQCDVGRLTQVIGTLLDNALKFTGVGQSKVVTVELSVHPDIARVEVRDEGSGIRAHELAHIFERHWQAPGGAKPGSGFGLWLARAISEAHGGTLTATSAFGEGTTLRLDLPLAAT
jgi:two-component system sensor histidine kinase BaeS